MCCQLLVYPRPKLMTGVVERASEAKCCLCKRLGDACGLCALPRGASASKPSLVNACLVLPIISSLIHHRACPPSEGP